MSNEYRDYMRDKAQEILLNTYVIDKITKTRLCSLYDAYIIEGLKNEQKVKFEVWFDNVEQEWKFERREL